MEKQRTERDEIERKMVQLYISNYYPTKIINTVTKEATGWTKDEIKDVYNELKALSTQEVQNARTEYVTEQMEARKQKRLECEKQRQEKYIELQNKKTKQRTYRQQIEEYKEKFESNELVQEDLETIKDIITDNQLGATKLDLEFVIKCYVRFGRFEEAVELVKSLNTSAHERTIKEMIQTTQKNQLRQAALEMIASGETDEEKIQEQTGMQLNEIRYYMTRAQKIRSTNKEMCTKGEVR